MAVDGNNLRDTSMLDSEDWIEFPCSPCERDDKYVASIKHCVECGKNLCKTCLSYHEEFTRGHQIVEKPRAKIEQKKSELPVQRCDKHGGKLVDVFCPGHDVVGCATCVAVNHSSCQGKQFIPDVVKSSPIAKEMSKLETNMEQLLTRLDKLKLDKQEQLKKIQTEKNGILKEIGDLRKTINGHLDRMENTLVSDVESRYAEKIQSTIQSVETYKNMMSSIAKSLKTLKKSRKINDAEMFVQIKQGEENLQFREHESRMKQFSSDKEMRSVKLFPNSFKDVLFGEKGNIFGRISEIIIPKSTEHFGDFSVRLQSDKQTCFITDVCLTTSGSIVCTDYNNKKLKKLDSSYNVIENLDMPSRPACLCEVDSSQLAVTLIDDKKVQFVFQQPLKLGKCFTVEDYCRGIDCRDGKLYVCCGVYENGGSGHIEMYDINGGLIRTFYEGLIKPIYVKATGDGELFVADNQGTSIKLFKVKRHDFSVSGIHIKTSTPTYIPRISRIGEGQLCVTGWMSNSIVLISQDGQQQQELLTQRDCIAKPWTVLFNENHSQLVVGFENSDIIKVYHVII